MDTICLLFCLITLLYNVQSKVQYTNLTHFDLSKVSKSGGLRDYQQLSQYVCTDNNCTNNCNVEVFPIGFCLPNYHGGAYFMKCSGDGDSFDQTQYSDTECQQYINNVHGSTDVCYDSGGPYVYFKCS